MGIIIRPEIRSNTFIISDADHVDDYLVNKLQGSSSVKVEVAGDATYKFLRLKAITPKPGITGKYVKLPPPPVPVDFEEPEQTDDSFEKAFLEEVESGLKLKTSSDGFPVSVYDIPPDVSSVFVEAVEAHFELNLPSAYDAAGSWLVVVGVDVTSGIAVQGSLHPNYTVEYNVNGESYTFVSDGQWWHVASHYAPHFYY